MSLPHIFRSSAGNNCLYAWFSAMHTRVDVMLVSEHDEAYMLAAVEEMRSRISEIENIANCFNPQSELSLFNSGRLKQHSLSPELKDILLQCKYWKKQTNGLFDVQVEGKYNLSGFLKGYALDQLKPILRARTLFNILINMGNSSVMALGTPSPCYDCWTVKNLNDECFSLRNQCLTTSGNDSDERKHIINPLTGEYISGKRMVSVITEGGVEGEVMATVKFITSKA